MPRVFKYEALYLEQKRLREAAEAENRRLRKAIEKALNDLGDHEGTTGIQSRLRAALGDR